MMVSNRGSVLRLLIWQWKLSLYFFACGLLPLLLRHLLPEVQLTIPSFPLGIAGGALGIFVSFRTNSAYDRWWEGRKLWGGLVNVSRHFGSQVLAYVPVSLVEIRKEILYRHVAYVHALRAALRGQAPAADPDVLRTIRAEERALLALSNGPFLLLDRQMQTLSDLHRDGHIDGFFMQSMERSLRECLDFQGGSERIKKTPMPRGYAFIAHRLILAFGFLLPFSLAGELGWLVLPMNLLVCLSFALISEAGRVLEDPFSLFWNGLPLYAISMTIETNLREALGERDLAPLPRENEHGILM